MGDAPHSTIGPTKDEQVSTVRPLRPPGPSGLLSRSGKLTVCPPLLQLASEGEANIDELIWDCEAVEQGT